MSRGDPFVPTISLALAGAALALFVGAGTPAALVLDRVAASSEPWRLITGHWVHLSWSHLFWDASAFAVLAAVLERRSRTLLLAVIATATAAISAAVVWSMPEVPAYAGLSGIDAALVAAVAVAMIRAGGTDRTIGAALGLAFAAKIAWEHQTGSVLFAGEPGVLHATSVHGIGAAAGVVTTASVHWLRGESST